MRGLPGSLSNRFRRLISPEFRSAWPNGVPPSIRLRLRPPTTLVDDEQPNLDLIEALLKPAGFSVLRADSGQQGIEIARSRLPNLILLDLMMPGVSGFEVVEQLRSREETRAIPIMILTAKTLSDDDKRSLNGHVAAIFQRNSVAGAELVDWLRDIVLKTAPAT